MRSPRCKTWLTFCVCSWKAVCKSSPHPALKQEIESSRMTVFTISSAGAGSLWDGRYLVNRTFFSCRVAEKTLHLGPLILPASTPLRFYHSCTPHMTRASSLELLVPPCGTGSRSALPSQTQHPRGPQWRCWSRSPHGQVTALAWRWS